VEGRLVRVRKKYVAAYPQPVRLRKGVAVTLRRRDSEWDGWTWCSTADDSSCWIPDSWLEVTGDSAVLIRDYDSTELTVNEGQPLRIELEESGWAWARAEDGSRGWVPLAHLRED